MARWSKEVVTRRVLLKGTGVGLVSLISAACGFGGKSDDAGKEDQSRTVDFSARFAL